jgi:hypothetical protein
MFNALPAVIVLLLHCDGVVAWTSMDVPALTVLSPSTTSDVSVLTSMDVPALTVLAPSTTSDGHTI